MVLKYYVKVPDNTRNFNAFSSGEIFEHHFFDDDDSYEQTKTIQQRKELIEKVRKLVEEKITKKRYKDYIWFRFDVYDDEANLLFAYHKFYNKKLLS